MWSASSLCPDNGLPNKVNARFLPLRVVYSTVYFGALFMHLFLSYYRRRSSKESCFLHGFVKCKKSPIRNINPTKCLHDSIMVNINTKEIQEALRCCYRYMQLKHSFPRNTNLYHIQSGFFSAVSVISDWIDCSNFTSNVAGNRM